MWCTCPQLSTYTILLLLFQVQHLLHIHLNYIHLHISALAFLLCCDSSRYCRQCKQYVIRLITIYTLWVGLYSGTRSELAVTQTVLLTGFILFPVPATQTQKSSTFRSIHLTIITIIVHNTLVSNLMRFTASAQVELNI